MTQAGVTTFLLEGVREQIPVARQVYDSEGQSVARSDPAPLPRNPLVERIDLKAALRPEVTLTRGDAVMQARRAVPHGSR